MKTFLAIIYHPMVVLLSSLVGATAMAVIQEDIWDAIGWFLPCLCVIIADLITGIRAARSRGEAIRKSKAIRATVNKVVSYGSWIIACVALNDKYGTEWCTWVGIGFIFFVEGLSFFGNVLEPKGYRLSVRGLLAVIGRRHNLEGVEDVIVKKDDNK